MRDPLWRGELMRDPLWRGELMRDPLWRGELMRDPLWRGELGRGPISRRCCGRQASPGVRLPAHCEAFLRQLALVSFEPTSEQSHQVAIRQSMRREATDALQQLAKLTVYREMHAVPIR